VKRIAHAVVAVLVMLCSACAGPDSATVQVGTLSDSRPNAYFENGAFTGFDNELLRVIAAKEGLRLEFTGTDFSALLNQVGRGRFAIGSAAIAQTEDRKKVLDFSNAYNYQALGIMTTASGAVSDERSLAGKRIGVVQSTVSDRWLGVNQPAAQEIRFPNDTAVMRALTGGTLDGALLDKANAQQYAAEYPGLAVTKIFDTLVPLGYAVRKGDGGLLSRINHGLRQVIAEGTWARLHLRFEPNEVMPREFRGHG
jgi:polar amino acid transport system substrate-binding protein